MKRAAWIIFVLTFWAGIAASASEKRDLVLVIGAPGAPEYAESFSNCAALWENAAAKGDLQTTVIGDSCDGKKDDRQQLLEVLSNDVALPDGELWVVLIGHGTYDGHDAKFNLRGPDITSVELAAALKPCRRPLAVIDCASASGPFLAALSGSNRVIITATRSGYEVNATRFGQYLAGAIGDPAADLDKDGQTSLLEAFLAASRDVAQFYKDQGRMQTEHALLDDNGDGLGTPGDWFEGVRAVKTPANGKSIDGIRAHEMFLVRGEEEKKLAPEMRARRDELEEKISALRSRKGQLSEDDYYRQLEALALEMARLYRGKS